MHFDRSNVSDLEKMLSTYDFLGDVALMEKAKELAKTIVGSGLSKYNFPSAQRSVRDVVGHNSRRRILVLGQVEDDLSIQYGSSVKIGGNDLVMRAIYENPGSQVMYRPHPETFAFNKPHYSNISDVEPYCHILGPEFLLSECISIADQIYTVTSLAGFEAALHGKPVVTFGRPFYAGWGFTIDREKDAARNRELTILEVLAGAYIKYPIYFHPLSNEVIDVSEAVKILQNIRSAAQQVDLDRRSI